jgi:hypothetical protein
MRRKEEERRGEERREREGRDRTRLNGGFGV